MAVFGYFEKNINNRDSIKVSGPANATIKGANLRFVNSSTNRSTGSLVNLRSECSITSIEIGVAYLLVETRYSTEVWMQTTVNITLDCNGAGGGGYGSGGYYGNPYGSGGNYWWNYGSGTIYYDPYDPNNWQNWWTTGGTTGYSPTVEDVTNQLGLSLGQSNWLSRYPSIAEQISNYLFNTTQSQGAAKKIAVQQINQMILDPDYLGFFEHHGQTGTPNTMWWEDDTWLSNFNNITFDLEENQANQYDQLNAAEKALVKLHPIEAWIMKNNRADAENETKAIYGNSGLNDKSDAFRHAFFNAMNQRDCGLDRNGLSIAKKFSDAHEASTPPQLQLEKDMDLFNNNIGHLIGGDTGVNMFTSDSYLSNKVLDKLVNGELRYLNPTLTPSQDPNFWGTGGVNNPLTATHGITSSTTLTPTNQ